MQTRNAHYSLNGHDVNVTLIEFTHTGMGIFRKAEAARSEAEIADMTDAELIAAFRNYPSPRKMTKPERAAHEGYKMALSTALISRGYCPDTVKWG